MKKVLIFALLASFTILIKAEEVELDVLTFDQNEPMTQSQPDSSEVLALKEDKKVAGENVAPKTPEASEAPEINPIPANEDTPGLM